MRPLRRFSEKPVGRAVPALAVGLAVAGLALWARSDLAAASARPAAGERTAAVLLVEPGSGLCEPAEAARTPLCPDPVSRAEPEGRARRAIAEFIDAGRQLLLDGQIDAAERALSEARSGALAAGDHASLATALVDLAHVALARAQSSRAASLLEEARSATSCAIADPERSDLILAEAALSLRLGPAADRTPMPELETDLRAACRTARGRGDWQRASYALGLLGRLEEQQGRLGPATVATQEALRALSWPGPADPSLVYRWQRQAGDLLERAGRAGEALAAYGMAADALDQARTTSPAGAASSLEEAQAFYDDYLGRLLERVETLGPTAAAGELLRNSVLTADRLTALEFEAYFRSPCLPRAARTAELPPGVAAIYPLVFADRTEVLLLSGKSITRLGPYRVGREAVGRLVDELRRSIGKGTGNDYRTPAAALYDLLVRDASAAIGRDTATLIFVPVDSLRSVPFAALYDDRAHEHLIDRYAVAVAPTISLIASQPAAIRRPTLLAGLLTELGDAQTARQQLNAERTYLADQFAGRSVILADGAFTRANIRNSLALSNFDIVHVTSHADFSASVEGSFIQLADERLPLPAFLNLLELAKFRDRPIEILVLAACKTALGDASRDAALGLAGAGVKAGARSVLASLWRIRLDDATALTDAFYRELAAGQARAMALRKAQLAIKEKRDHPASWAPFVLIGNWR